MTLKNASRETLLTWLVRSKRTAAREGRMPVDWGREIYIFPLVVFEFSCVDDKVCSIWGSNGIFEGDHVTGKLFVEGVGDMAGDQAADGGRRMAVGMPSGQSFDFSSGSL
jgi:hypothetical protein